MIHGTDTTATVKRNAHVDAFADLFPEAWQAERERVLRHTRQLRVARLTRLAARRG